MQHDWSDRLKYYNTHYHLISMFLYMYLFTQLILNIFLSKDLGQFYSSNNIFIINLLVLLKRPPIQYEPLKTAITIIFKAAQNYYPNYH